MKNFKTVFLWMYMFSKRLLKNVSFLIILLLIPLFVFFMGIVLKGDSGILRICLSAEKRDAFTDELISKYTEDPGVIEYTVCDTPEDAQTKVENGSADAAWVFAPDLEQKIYDYASNPSNHKHFVTVIERESNVALLLSHIVLFEEIYPTLSYDIYENFVKNEIGVKDDRIIKTAYENNSDLSEIVKIDYINSDYAPKTSLVSSPLRGMLSLIIMLCAIAAAMLFIKDRKTGKYDWLKQSNHIIPAAGLCVSAALISGFAVLIAVYAAGINTSAGVEIISVLEYILAAAAFGTVICALFRSEGLIASLLPIFILVMLLICPIFFNFKALKPLKMLFPPYYYLNAVNEPRYLLYMPVYIVCTYTVAFILNRIISKRSA
ncbi:MAG: ABC transporter permease [Clostridia bacterium]|nr:ABC transporter permease [Clostridia bacterium]